MKYYSYGHYEGIRFHKTEEDAIAAATEGLHDAQDELSEGFDRENQEQISWGIVKQEVVRTARPLTEEERKIYDDFEVMIELSLKDVEVKK